MLKKITAVLLMGVVLTASSAFAAQYKTQADGLNKLGLFRGTENGYELDSTFTRAQGAAMLVRLLGKEKEALSTRTKGIFRDIPTGDWPEPYVEYCYNHGITKGTGKETYSPEEPMSGSEYLTLVLRALGYENAEPENADIAAAEYSLLSSREAREIMIYPLLSRDKMVYISYQALSTVEADGETLIEKLIADGAVDVSAARSLKLIK